MLIVSFPKCLYYGLYWNNSLLQVVTDFSNDDILDAGERLEGKFILIELLPKCSRFK